MNNIKKNSNKFFEKLKRKVPSNIKIEKVTKENKVLAEEFLKSRKDLGITFNPIHSHFGENWDYDLYPLGYLMINNKNNSIVGFRDYFQKTG